jgi:uncharacterized protein YfiM (DUF2279 family)
MVGTIRTFIIFLAITLGYCNCLYAQKPSPNLLQDDRVNGAPDLNLTKTQDKFFAPDKAQHLMGSLISTVFFYKIFEGPAGANSTDSKYLAGGLTLSIGISKEILDSSDLKNHFSWKDLIADIAGISLGFVIIKQP